MVRVAQRLTPAVGDAGANFDWQVSVVRTVREFGVLLPFSRERETEADAMGLLYMARAGYDPREALSFWQRMENSGGRQSPEFISTHPSHESRIHRLQELMPKALAVYESSSTKS